MVNTGDRPGSTRIIEIVDEGTPVKVGEIVCELESSAFRDEIAAQQIRVGQALAWVEQAKTLVEVNEITQREYRDGVYPQDLNLIRQYIKGCELELDRAQKTVGWSEEMREAKFRTSQQHESEVATLVAAELNLQQAQGMFKRLDKYTRDRLFMSLDAKMEASKGDLLAQELAYQRESDRLERLERMVENCTIRAPHDGIVVYANQANAWGRLDVRIQTGTVVREGQAIFSLPEPTKLRVKARINESRISFIESGMPVVVKIDAFPDRPLKGTVGEIVPISTRGGGPFSDTKIYSAMIHLDEAFDELRPGLSAEVVMQVKTRADVIRIPVESVRWQGLQVFAAITRDQGITFSWQPLKLGLTNETNAEVLDGLNPGDVVIADPSEFPKPETQEVVAPRVME